jgi:hypothetical protein
MGISVLNRRFARAADQYERTAAPASLLNERDCMDANEYRSFLGSVDREALLSFFEAQAAKHCDGHYSILSFTTGHKVAFWTPDLDTGHGRNEVAELPAFSTLKDALVDALVTGRSFYSTVDSEALAAKIREQATAELKPAGA